MGHSFPGGEKCVARGTRGVLFHYVRTVLDCSRHMAGNTSTTQLICINYVIDDVITVTSSKNHIKETNAPKSITQLLKPSDSSHRRCVCIDLR